MQGKYIIGDMSVVLSLSSTNRVDDAYQDIVFTTSQDQGAPKSLLEAFNISQKLI